MAALFPHSLCRDMRLGNMRLAITARLV